MKILIPTLGSRGDVQPCIALAQGLERTGRAALQAIVRQADLQRTASRLGEPVRNEKGVSEAVRLIAETMELDHEGHPIPELRVQYAL